MCDRTKVEVLARELSIEYRSGKLSEGTRYTNYTNGKDFTENNWKRWKKTAQKLLIILEKHK